MGVALDDVGEDALVIRGQVLHQHERHAGVLVGGHPGEEGFEGLEAPCRGADADDGKPGHGAFDRLLQLDRCLGDFRRLDGLGFGRLFSLRRCNPASKCFVFPNQSVRLSCGVAHGSPLCH